MIPAKAMTRLSTLEKTSGQALKDVPMGARDQFTAAVREDFTKLGANITDPREAQIAFAGAFIMADAMFQGSVCQLKVVQFTSYLLRDLSARANGDPVPDLDEVSPVRSWRMRLMRWLSE